MKPNSISYRVAAKWRKFRDETFPDLICFSLIGLTLFVLHEHGGASSTILSFVSGYGAVFSSIYISFALQRVERDGTTNSLWDRLSFLVSALGFAVLYGRFGFPEMFPGSGWLYGAGSFILIFVVSLAVKELNPSEQDVDRKPDHVAS